MSSPEGFEVKGPGGIGSLSAYGPNAMWLTGFLLMAGAIVWQGYEYRKAMTDQTAFFVLLVNHAAQAHADIENLCRAALGQPSIPPVPRTDRAR